MISLKKMEVIRRTRQMERQFLLAAMRRGARRGAEYSNPVDRVCCAPARPAPFRPHHAPERWRSFAQFATARTPPDERPGTPPLRIRSNSSYERQ